MSVAMALWAGPAPVSATTTEVDAESAREPDARASNAIRSIHVDLTQDFINENTIGSVLTGLLPAVSDVKLQKIR